MILDKITKINVYLFTFLKKKRNVFYGMNYTSILIMFTSKVFTSDQLLEIQYTAVYNGPVSMPYFLLYSLNPVHCDHPSLAAMYSLSKLLPFLY